MKIIRAKNLSYKEDLLPLKPFHPRPVIKQKYLEIMLTVIQNLPVHVFGVRASGEVTKDDLKNMLLPGLESLSERYKEIYYLLVLETDVQNFTAGAWIQDLIAGIKHFTDWKKMAIVTDQKAVEKFTDIFSYVSPAEAKGFELNDLQAAIDWLNIKS
ncbi:STAS/SEC14 domain-containing protein [Pedobacter frigoris]|uniref:STAS/SEC14 domain-containing protein n=1 Tax=Pedobacter frigoris TaxID=2571272 RepID=UPI00293015E7|nr:STAS/SEC14 domain-containing protein [Pedobacter frigoris]